MPVLKKQSTKSLKPTKPTPHQAVRDRSYQVGSFNLIFRSPIKRFFLALATPLRPPGYLFIHLPSPPHNHPLPLLYLLPSQTLREPSLALLFRASPVHRRRRRSRPALAFA